MSKESNDYLLLVLAWWLPFYLPPSLKQPFLELEKEGRDIFVDMFMWISSYFDSDVACFLKSIKANLLSCCVFQGAAWKSVVLAMD